MPVAISTYSVKCALRPYLGSDMVDGTPIAEEAAHALRSYAPYKDTLEDLARRVGQALFDVLYSTLGPRMILRLDSGEMARIHMDELPDVADAVLGVMFEGMTVYSVSYQTLKDYSLRTGSLSAMRVLYQKYDDFQSADEKALMARIIRDNHPRERYMTWLKDEA
ncbi:MAG: hypothetical protein E7316_09590 [Clostridiales bacterium]|nr:hypothetical protein [Clostridiales bacterium]